MIDGHLSFREVDVFLGHFGMGFGAKAAAPRASLGVLFLAAQFVDLLWPTLLFSEWGSRCICE
jgi:hypothetical protein